MIGSPVWVKEKYQDTALRIPMSEHIRSLNLSNTAALLIYEALRHRFSTIELKFVYFHYKNDT